MKSYLTPKRDAAHAETVRRVPINGPVGIYRRDDGSHSVLAETDDEIIELGVRDAAVSRKKSGSSPVELLPDARGVRIRNQNSKNPVSVKTNLGEQQLAEGENTVIDDDCIIELGITTEIRATVERDRDTLSKEELQEKLGMEQEGDVMQGVSPTAHARAIAVNLRKATNESVPECRKYATELKNFVAEHEVDDPDYESVFDQLQQVTTRLETKSSGALRGSGIDDEWKEEIDLLADRVEKLYGRAD
jgi:hypothetical protein